MVSPFTVPTLRGRYVVLEPLSIEHVASLVASSGEDQSTYVFTQVPRGPQEMTSYVDALIEEGRVGTVTPFAQVDGQSGRAVGVTRFMTFRTLAGSSLPFAVEIGGTWLGASAQRTGVNTEAKLLMMSHAFDSWGVARVDFKTDARNERSRAAIARIGATFEGVLRHWQPSLVDGEQGSFRDTAMFSVLDSEWTIVREALRAKLR